MIPIDHWSSAAFPIRQGRELQICRKDKQYENARKGFIIKNYGQQSTQKTAAYPFADKAKTNLVEVRRVNTASTISQRDAYKLMLKDYPDVMSIEQMCEILSISTKTGYRILREGKICCLKVGRAYRIPKAHLFTFLCIGCGEAVTA